MDYRLWRSKEGPTSMTTGNQAQNKCPALEADSGMGATVGVRLYQPEIEDWPAFNSLLGPDSERRVWLGIFLGELYCDPCIYSTKELWASASHFTQAANISVKVQTGGTIGRYFPARSAAESAQIKMSHGGKTDHDAFPALQIYTRECWRPDPALGAKRACERSKKMERG